VRPPVRCDRPGMTDRPHPVLVGIDGTASGLEAVALGSALAVATGSPLVLATVYGFEGQYWPPVATADRWLDEATERVDAAIACTTTSMLSTSAAHGLSLLAAREDAGLIVLGASGEGAFGRALLGSTVAGVVHGAPCAVAVVPHGWRMRSSEEPLVFGVGLTSSPEAQDAVALAARLAGAVHAPLRVLSAVQLPPPEHPMFAALGIGYEDFCRAQRRDAEHIARHAVAGLDVQTEIVIEVGDPVARLTEASRDLDLLVVGSRRYGPLRRALLGSVSARLVDHAACPVLIVPRGVHPEASRSTALEAQLHV
jgi:nucleotide-binding universal stress UspA family protein